MGSETRPSSGKPPLKAAPMPAEEVVSFLIQHPDFFTRHPQLLAAMSIPHECGPAASLIEHQVQVLKKETADMHAKFRELMDNARLNEELSQRIHRLVLALVQARDLDECLGALYQGLGENFGADMISLRIFAQARDVCNQGLGEFVSDNDCDLFQSVFSQGHPVCGQATSAQLEFLFQDQARLVGSTALVPIRFHAVQEGQDPTRSCALLAIGSRDATRFKPGMGTVYLSRLAEIIGQTLHRYVP